MSIAQGTYKGTISISPEAFAWLRQVSDAYSLPRNYIIRLLLVDALRNETLLQKIAEVPVLEEDLHKRQFQIVIPPEILERFASKNEVRQTVVALLQLVTAGPQIPLTQIFAN